MDNTVTEMINAFEEFASSTKQKKSSLSFLGALLSTIPFGSFRT